MKFFRCNCTNIEEGIEIANANLFILEVKLHSMNNEKIINLTLDLNIVLEGFKLDRKKDCLYLLNLKDLNDDIQYTMTKLNTQFQISLNKQDDSSQQFYLNLNLNVFEGQYKLLYLQSKDEYFTQKEWLYGEWEILGSSQQIEIEFIQQDLKDVTNLVMRPHHQEVEDENPKIKYSVSKTPKLKRKK